MTSFDVTGKVAIVTGAAQGIGIELATSLAEFGADVAVLDINEELLKQTAKEIAEATGKKIIPVKVDVTSEQSVEEAVAEVMKEFGHIDILVNNAGLNRYGAAHELSLADWNTCLSVDLTGVFLMCKTVVNAYMLEHGGRIVNIASVNSIRAHRAAPVYHTAKTAVVAFTQSAACGWAKYGIFANVVSPGYMTNGGMSQKTPQAVVDSIRKSIPQDRVGRYGDLSGAVLYLVSDANQYTQGQNIVCDGGMTLESY